MHHSHLMLAGVALASAARFASDAATGSGTPADDGSIPRRSLTIAGETFEIAAPYSEGHTLNAAEASVLNQTYAENIRNNAAGRIKAAKEQAEANGTTFSLDTPVGGEGENATKTLRQLITEYAESYEFGVRVARASEPVDPVEREARAIAREAINTLLKDQGVKRKDVDEAAYDEAVSTHAKDPDIVKEAKRRVEARSKIGLGTLNLKAKAPAQAEG